MHYKMNSYSGLSMVKRPIIVLSLVLALVSMSASQGYVYQNISRPSIDSETNFFKLGLEFEPDVVVEEKDFVLTAKDLSTNKSVEKVDLFFEGEYLGKTGSNGSYSFSIDEAGKYNFRAEIADYEAEKSLEVLPPERERLTVESNGMVSGNFLAYTSGLDYLMFMLIALAFFAGYLQHSGRFTVFKIVE